MVNVYGLLEYHVLHGHDAEILYRSVDYIIELHMDVDYGYSTRRWLEIAKNYLSTGKDYSSPWYILLGIDFLLRTSLMSICVESPYTRDLRVLYDMLPSEKRPPLDIYTVMRIWEEMHRNDSQEQDYFKTILPMGKDVYDFVTADMRHDRDMPHQIIQ